MGKIKLKEIDSLISSQEVSIVFGVNALILIISLFNSTDSYRNSEKIGLLFFGFTILYNIYYFHFKLNKTYQKKVKKFLKGQADFDDDIKALKEVKGGCSVSFILFILAIIGAFAYNLDYLGFWEYILTAYFWFLSSWFLIFTPLYTIRHFFKIKLNLEFYYLIFNISKLAILYFPAFVIMTLVVAEGD
jgi:hypothetical protein